MNQQAFQAGKSAYQKGDWLGCASILAAAKDYGEVSGAVDHLRGNALMKLGRFSEAADAYSAALLDESYGKTGALKTNRGRAYLAAGMVDQAIDSLTEASQDSTYATPYKAYMALGNAQSSLGNARAAGVAFRNAAIDETNPDPSAALSSLGRCFMDMGRPGDAVEAYRTALDFSTPMANQSVIYADLGMAYVAANGMEEAVDAFNHASSDGTYQLTPEQQASFEAARKAVAVRTPNQLSDTDAMLSAAGYGPSGSLGTTGGFDPLDPLGKSGEFIPSPEDTGFFSIDEQEIVQQDKRNRKVRRKHRHTGLKVFIVLLLLLAAAAAFLWYEGFGWPTQKAVITDLFNAASSGDISEYLAEGADEERILEVLPTDADIEVACNPFEDADYQSATAYVTATMSAGGETTYDVTLARDGVIGWKVVDVESADDLGTTATLEGSATTEDAAADDASTEGTEAGATDETATDASDETATETTDEAAETEGTDEAGA